MYAASNTAGNADTFESKRTIEEGTLENAEESYGRGMKNSAKNGLLYRPACTGHTQRNTLDECWPHLGIFSAKIQWRVSLRH